MSRWWERRSGSSNIIDGKEKVLTVGKYPLMSLQETRDKAWIAKKDVSTGINPVKAKKLAVKDNTFRARYQEWYEHKKQVWSVGYADELARMFRMTFFRRLAGWKLMKLRQCRYCR